MKFCAHCGKPLAEDNAFCPGCGKAIASAVPTAPEPAPVPTPVIFDPGSIVAPPVKEKKVKEKASSRKWIGLLVGLLVLGVLCTAGYFFLRWYTSPEQESLRAIDAGNFDKCQFEGSS